MSSMSYWKVAIALKKYHYVALYSYYPLHPPAEDVNIDYERFEKYALLPCNPDILILPSDLRYFAKVGNGTLSLGENCLQREEKPKRVMLFS